MSDIEAIQQLLNRYSEGASRRDWPQVMATFTEDGVWSVPVQGVELTGHAAIQPAMEGFVAQMDYFVQMNSAAVIEVAGNRATSRCVIRECGKFFGRDEALEVLGEYVDELTRTAEGWKFARRSFHSFGLQRFPLLPGVALPG
jgi:ketosteroid isomerase-like protein